MILPGIWEPRWSFAFIIPFLGFERIEPCLGIEFDLDMFRLVSAKAMKEDVRQRHRHFGVALERLGLASP
jgi:hypothetical protein